MELRKIALITFIASVVSDSEPTWQAIAGLKTLEAARPQSWLIPLGFLIVAAGAVTPVFYFALFRYEGTMHFSRGLRKVALVVATIFSITIVMRFQESPRVLNWHDVIALLADLSYFLVLLSMSREGNEEPVEQIPVPELLRFVTKLAVLVGSVWVAFQLTRLPYTVFTYSFMQRAAFQAGRSAPPLRDMLRKILLTIFSQAALLVAPYIVWRSDFGRRVVN
jgi:hypothetical protein